MGLILNEIFPASGGLASHSRKAKFSYRLGVLVIYMGEQEVYVPIVHKTPP